MSSVSSSSSSSETLSYLLQMLKEQREQAAQTGGTDATTGTTQVQATSFEDQFEAAAEEAGLDTDQLSGLKDDIQTAVSDALANYDESTSTTSLDETITNAIEGVLEDNGLDADDVESRLQTVMETMQDNMSAAGGPPPGGAPMGPPPPPPSSSEEDSSTSTTSSTTSTSTSSTEETATTSGTTDTDATSVTQSLISKLLDSSESNTDFLANLSGILFGLDVQA